ncbi:MAG: hypothetical protein HYZ29_19690, partial [Myxococcales bacterium]|nr:hypothetical protein [Myxococcales bacterium]
GSDGGSGTGGSGTGGSGTGGSSTGGGSGSGGASTGGASGGGGSGGSAGTCSVLTWDGCTVLMNCMSTKCATQIKACYGNNFAANDATGSICESLWTCSKTCACGDNGCLVNTCYSTASSACQACIPDITTCLQANCQAEAGQC